jgi:hypothetical protein
VICQAGMINALVKSRICDFFTGALRIFKRKTIAKQMQLLCKNKKKGDF